MVLNSRPVLARDKHSAYQSGVGFLVQSARLSFTAIAISCSDPRYLSVVWIDECPSRNLICSRSPPFFLHNFAQVRRRSWAPKCSIPICFDDCSTTDHPAQSLSVSRLTFPLLETDRSSLPSSMPA